MQIESQLMVEMLYKMLKSRLFEEKAIQMVDQGIIESDLHLSIGQEGCAVASCMAMEPQDLVFGTHRNFGAAIACDVDAGKMFAELIGSEKGTCSGQGGQGQIADPSVHFMGGNDMPGENIGIATGAALSMKRKKNDRCVLCFLGDGTSNEGIFHEAVNFASVNKLPIIYLIENNQYAGSMPFNQVSSVEDIAERAKGYTVPGIIVDGNNALEVYEAVKRALTFTQSGKGPVIVECKTCRLSGQTYLDGQEYRDKNEIEAWMKKCPVNHLSNYMIQQGIGIQEDLYMIRNKAQMDIDEAYQYAVEGLQPDQPEKNEATAQEAYSE